MGKYVNENLIKNESVEFETNLHWIQYLTMKSFLSLGIIPYLYNRFSEFVITNRRVVIKTGMVSVKTFEMNLSKIESINVSQTFLGRVLGYGTLTVIGTGGTKEEFTDISNPIQFKKMFQQIS